MKQSKNWYFEWLMRVLKDYKGAEGKQLYKHEERPLNPHINT